MYSTLAEAMQRHAARPDDDINEHGDAEFFGWDGHVTRTPIGVVPACSGTDDYMLFTRKEAKELLAAGIIEPTERTDIYRVTSLMPRECFNWIRKPDEDPYINPFPSDGAHPAEAISDDQYQTAYQAACDIMNAHGPRLTIVSLAKVVQMDAQQSYAFGEVPPLAADIINLGFKYSTAKERGEGEPDPLPFKFLAWRDEAWMELNAFETLADAQSYSAVGPAYILDSTKSSYLDRDGRVLSAEEVEKLGLSHPNEIPF